MATGNDTPMRVQWARLRFSIIGPLLSAPPEDGELKTRIEELAARAWVHPSNGQSTRFSFKTIERWFYAARGAADPIAVLARKVPSHAGTQPSVSAALGEAIQRLHSEHHDGPSSSTTTTSSRSRARIHGSVRCPATRPCAAT